MKWAASIIALTLAAFTSPPWGHYPSGRNYWRAQNVYSGMVERSWVVYQTNSVPTNRPAPFAFDRENLVGAKGWTVAVVTNFLRVDSLPGFTNWTPATIIADSLLPADYWTNTPFAALSAASNGWNGMTAILARLTVTWVPGGCLTNCGRTASMCTHAQSWAGATNYGESVCTNYGSWSFVAATNDNQCALPYAASVITDGRVRGTNYVWRYVYTSTPFPPSVQCDDEDFFKTALDSLAASGSWTTNSDCNNDGSPPFGFETSNGYHYVHFPSPDEGCVSSATFTELVSESPAYCSGSESLCLSRSSWPIGYQVPTTNIACIRVEYLAAGLPGGCGPSVFQTETISDGLSNGAWVVWSSNAAASTPYFCDEDFITTAAPFGSCTTNAGWAITDAKALLHWQFEYK